MFGQVSPIEIIVVLVIALIVFGPTRLPELARSAGKGIRDFKASIDGTLRDTDLSTDGPDSDAAAPAAAKHDDPILEGVLVSGSEPPGPVREPGA